MGRLVSSGGRTIRRSGCQCHGVAGNAELFVEAAIALDDKKQLETARAFGSALLVRAGATYRVLIGDDSRRSSAPGTEPMRTVETT